MYMYTVHYYTDDCGKIQHIGQSKANYTLDFNELDLI